MTEVLVKNEGSRGVAIPCKGRLEVVKSGEERKLKVAKGWLTDEKRDEMKAKKVTFGASATPEPQSASKQPEPKK